MIDINIDININININIDRPAVKAVTTAVASPVGDFDGAGSSAPGAVEAGPAIDVVTGILATLNGCATR